MTDTVTRLLALADAYADANFEQGLKRIKHDERPEIKRQALHDELVRLFTPLSDEQKPRKGDWLDTTRPKYGIGGES